MTTTLYYTFRDENNKVILQDFPYSVGESLQDIIEYKFQDKYGKPYDEHNWYLEDEAESFVKDITNKWWENSFNTFELYHDIDFKDWLLNKYYDVALREAMSHVEYIDDYINDFDKYQMSLFDIKEDNKNE